MIEVIQLKQAVLAQKLRKARKELGLTQKEEEGGFESNDRLNYS